MPKSTVHKARRKYTPPESAPPKCATALIVRADGKILLVLPEWTVRKKKLAWEEPGGKINANETPLDCCIRETKEETDIDLSTPDFVQVGYVYSKWPKANVYVFATKTMPEGKVVDPAEINKLQWFDTEPPLMSFRLSQSMKLAAQLITKARDIADPGYQQRQMQSLAAVMMPGQNVSIEPPVPRND